MRIPFGSAMSAISLNERFVGAQEETQWLQASSWAMFIRKTKSPELSVLLLEDSGALCGLLFDGETPAPDVPLTATVPNAVGPL